MRLEPHVDAVEQALVVREERRGELGVAGRSFGERNLPAQLDRGLVEDDVVAGRVCLGCRRHSRRAATDDRDAQPAPRPDRCPRQLPPRARVLGAGDRDAGVVVGDARVAADATELRHAFGRLARQIGVGDERAGHPDRVRDSLGDEPFGRGGIDDSRGRDQGRPDAERGRMARDRAFLDGRRRDNPGRAAVGGGIAERDRDVVHECGELGGDGDGSLRVGGEPDPEGEAGSRLPHSLGDGDEELRTGRPFVLAEVHARREELGEEVVVGGGKLDAVEASLGGERGGVRVPGDDLLDLLDAERARLDVEALARDGRRRDRGWSRWVGDELAPAVEELDEETRPVCLDGPRDALVAGDDLRLVPCKRVRRQAARLVDGRRFEDDHPGAARGSRLVVGDELLCRQVVVDERRLMRSRDDPVRQLDGPERERAQQMRELRHRRARARVRPAPNR
jgi:hypothetical protein